MTIPHLRKSIGPATAGRGYFIAVALACFGLWPAPKAFGVSPPPDGGYANENTAEGTSALQHLTIGSNNTANGADALFNNTTGSYNTATGSGTLIFLTSGTGNTAIGFQALASNTTGGYNTATGFGALFHNTTLGEGDNTANGADALFYNTTGIRNTATGVQALYRNTTGSRNTASGVGALSSNTTGNTNAAFGNGALFNNTTGGSNTALGYSAGYNLTGSNNIDIGNLGVAGASNTIRIGNAVATVYPDGTTHPAQTATFIAGIHGATVAGSAVTVNNLGQLGVAPSAARFKNEIKPMDKTSEAILALKPVTFRYKKEIDPAGTAQFGLVAEEVAAVNPDLVVRDKEGKAYTVRYDAVNAMLLNEFLKERKAFIEEQRKAQEQEAITTQLKSNAVKQEATIAELKSGIETLTATMKKQASQIQKVSAQLEVSKPATQTVLNNQ
jgi:hypothetical protein